MGYHWNNIPFTLTEKDIEYIMKWFDENGTDVDANPSEAFKGGVYDRQRVTYMRVEYCQSCGKRMSLASEITVCSGCMQTAKKDKVNEG